MFCCLKDLTGVSSLISAFAVGQTQFGASISKLSGDKINVTKKVVSSWFKLVIEAVFSTRVLLSELLSARIVCVCVCVILSYIVQ